MTSAPVKAASSPAPGDDVHASRVVTALTGDRLVQAVGGQDIEPVQVPAQIEQPCWAAAAGTW